MHTSAMLHLGLWLLSTWWLQGECWMWALARWRELLSPARGWSPDLYPVCALRWSR